MAAGMITEGARFDAVDELRLDPELLFMTSDTEYPVRVYFLHEGAGYHNSLGFSTALAGSDELGTGHLIFPNASFGHSRTSSTPVLSGDFVVSFASEFSFGVFESERGTIHQRITRDWRSRVLTAIDAIGEEPLIGDTDMAYGLTLVPNVYPGNQVRRKTGFRTVVLFSDGINNDGGDPVAVATSLAAQGYTIHTVSFSDQAAYEAARELVDLDSDEQEAYDKADRILQAANLELANMEVIEGSTAPDTTEVTVVITAQAANHWSPLRYFANHEFTAQATLDHENKSGGL